MPQTAERQAEVRRQKRAAAAIAAGREVGVNGRPTTQPRDDATDKGSPGVSILCVELDAATSGATEEQKAARRNAAKRNKRERERIGLKLQNAGKLNCISDEEQDAFAGQPLGD